MRCLRDTKPRYDARFGAVSLAEEEAVIAAVPKEWSGLLEIGVEGPDGVRVLLRLIWGQLATHAQDEQARG